MRSSGSDDRPSCPGLYRCRGACDDYKLQLPWPFMPLHAAGHQLFTQFWGTRTRCAYPGRLPSFAKVSNTSRVLNFDPLMQVFIARSEQWMQKPMQHQGSPRLLAEEQDDAEAHALAISLAGRQRATLLEFYSPRCSLCQSLLKVVQDVERKERDWLRIVMADVENKKWLPEASLYEINYVPCFVLLDSQGTALAKSGVPHSRVHVLKGLSFLLESMRPIRGALKRVPVIGRVSRTEKASDF